LDFRLILLAFGAFAGTTESSLLPGLMPQIGSTMDVTVAQSGYMIVVYSIAYAVAAPILSSLLGAADRRRTLAIAELIVGLCALVIALAPTFPLMVAARAVLGCGAVLFTSMAQSTAYALSPPERRGRSVAVVMTGGTLAVALGAPLFALISVHSGWRIGYGLVAILAVTSGLLIWFRLPPGIVGERRSISERLAVLRVPGVRVVLFTGLLFGVGAFLPNVYVAVVSINSMGMDVGAVPLALLAMGVGAVIGGIAAGQMIDRLGAYRTFLLFAVTTTVLLLLIPVLPLLPSPLIAPLWLLVLALLGLVAWALFAALVNILAAFAPTEVPLVISLNLTAGSFGGAVAAFLGGIAAERFGAASIGLLGAAFTIAALGLALANRRTLRNPG
jgi:MFS transporter, DHA1 family, inner membrane transport protein